MGDLIMGNKPTSRIFIQIKHKAWIINFEWSHWLWFDKYKQYKSQPYCIVVNLLFPNHFLKLKSNSGLSLYHNSGLRFLEQRHNLKSFKIFEFFRDWDGQSYINGRSAVWPWAVNLEKGPFLFKPKPVRISWTFLDIFFHWCGIESTVWIQLSADIGAVLTLLIKFSSRIYSRNILCPKGNEVILERL